MNEYVLVHRPTKGRHYRVLVYTWMGYGTTHVQTAVFKTNVFVMKFMRAHMHVWVYECLRAGTRFVWHWVREHGQWYSRISESDLIAVMCGQSYWDRGGGREKERGKEKEWKSERKSDRKRHINIYMYIYIYIHVCVYICIYMYVYIHVYIHIHIWRERERERAICAAHLPFQQHSYSQTQIPVVPCSQRVFHIDVLELKHPYLYLSRKLARPAGIHACIHLQVYMHAFTCRYTCMHSPAGIHACIHGWNQYFVRGPRIHGLNSACVFQERSM